MQTGLVHLHSLLRWVILILLLISIVKAYTGWKSGTNVRAGDRKIWLFTMIASHLTLLLGLYQWLIGRYGIISMHLPEGTSAPEGKYLRFFQIEHPVMMILAILLITRGYTISKKPFADGVGNKKVFQYFVIALLIILLMIPWPFRELIGRPLFPGM
jgi:hypothetical protein